MNLKLRIRLFYRHVLAIFRSLTSQKNLVLADHYAANIGEVLRFALPITGEVIAGLRTPTATHAADIIKAVETYTGATASDKDPLKQAVAQVLQGRIEDAAKTGFKLGSSLVTSSNAKSLLTPDVLNYVVSTAIKILSASK